jgi:hypothetical protein
MQQHSPTLFWAACAKGDDLMKRIDNPSIVILTLDEFSQFLGAMQRELEDLEPCEVADEQRHYELVKRGVGKLELADEQHDCLDELEDQP